MNYIINTRCSDKYTVDPRSLYTLTNLSPIITVSQIRKLEFFIVFDVEWGF